MKLATFSLLLCLVSSQAAETWSLDHPPAVPPPAAPDSKQPADPKDFAEIKLDFPITPGPFEPTWDSIQKHHPGAPGWFRDAKFGVFVHWGPQASGKSGDWYARNFYREGHPAYQNHLRNFGHPSEFGYKDVLNAWKAPKWDAAALTQSFHEAGMKSSTLWNDEPIRSVGKGKLYTKGDMAAAISDFKITPLIQFPGTSGVTGAARQTEDETLFFIANTTAKSNSFTTSFRINGLRPELWDAETGTIRFAPVWRQKNGRTEVDLTLDTFRSIFVVFRDSMLPADHVVAVAPQSLPDESQKPLNLGTPATADFVLTAAGDGTVIASATSATRAELVFASGKRQPITLAEPPAPSPLAGPWQVSLDSPVDQKRKLTLPSLADLASHPDPAVKYFSGTATYSKQFQISDLKSQIHLNLGKVHDLARVTLNGKDLGVIWQPPFTLDITSALRTGENQLEIAVTNTWHNRLVGDEQFPADFEWGEDRGDKGHAMKAYPDWFITKQPRPQQGRK